MAEKQYIIWPKAPGYKEMTKGIGEKKQCTMAQYDAGFLFSKQYRKQSEKAEKYQRQSKILIENKNGFLAVQRKSLWNFTPKVDDFSVWIDKIK